MTQRYLFAGARTWSNRLNMHVSMMTYIGAGSPKEACPMGISRVALIDALLRHIDDG